MGGRLPEIENARLITKAIIAEIIRGLRTGKSPKEISVRIGESVQNVWVIIHRYRGVHDIFVETHPLRYPHKDTIPPKMLSSLREV